MKRCSFCISTGFASQSVVINSKSLSLLSTSCHRGYSIFLRLLHFSFPLHCVSFDRLLKLHFALLIAHFFFVLPKTSQTQKSYSSLPTHSPRHPDKSNVPFHCTLPLASLSSPKKFILPVAYRIRYASLPLIPTPLAKASLLITLHIDVQNTLLRQNLC